MSKIEIATIIPFCKYDKHLVKDAINSILDQEVPTRIYVVGDGVSKNDIMEISQLYSAYNCVYFFQSDGIGPYCIANSIVRYHTQAEYIALQDADDISYPTRLKSQLSVLKDVFEHTSAAMKQTAMFGYTGNRHKREPTLLCGVRAGNIPMGRFINSTRMIRRGTFEALNGFSDMYCSGDLAFDNVIRALRIPSYECRQVLAERRLHADSLTNNPMTDRQSGLRSQAMKRLKANLAKILTKPTLETAQEIGSLDKAEPLSFIGKTL